MTPSTMVEPDEAAAAEIRRLEAKLAAMQRAFDNLTSDMTRQDMSTQGRPLAVPMEPAARRAWIVAGALGGVVVLLLIAFFVLNNA